MSLLGRQLALTSALAGVVFLQAQSFSRVQDAPVQLPPDSLTRAISTGNNLLLDLSLSQGVDVNGRDAEGRTALLVATLQRDGGLVRRLLDGGAKVDIGDNAGLTALMVAARDGQTELLRELVSRSENVGATDSAGRTAAHYAVALRQYAALELLLPAIAVVNTPTADGRDLVAMACDSGDVKIVEAVLGRAGGNLAWAASTQGALRAAIAQRNGELTRLLLSRHVGPPTAEGTNVPLLAHAVVKEDLQTLKALLAAGADPNVTIPAPPTKEFVASVPSNYLRDYVAADQQITPLMLAAGLGRTEFLRALLDAGADKNRTTPRYKMMALYFAARAKNPKGVQILLGRGPSRDELRVEISLAAQRATVYKDGVSVFNTAVSTGKKGFDTPAGEYVITDKSRTHRSTLYHAEMPFFMRLNCLDFGLHAGVVPNYPASHGCIRLPADVAEKLFGEIPVGTMVSIN